MENENMVSQPTITYRDSSENDEPLKSELEPGEVDTQHSNFEEEEGTVLLDSCSLNEIDCRTKRLASDIDLNDSAIRTENQKTGSDSNEVNEIITENERSSIQIMGLHEPNNETQGTPTEISGVDAVESLSESRIGTDILVHNLGDVRNEDGQFYLETEVEMDLVDSPIRQVNVEVADNVIVSENLSRFGFTVNALDSQNDVLVHNSSKHNGPVSGFKRARITHDQEQASVHVTFNSLTRSSKRKLEELLIQWSEWHARHGSSSQESNEVLESGEETYFPALSVGIQKSSSVSFWIENQMKKEQSSDLLPESVSVPLYDRGFAFGLTSADTSSNVEGGLEIVGEAARCFNCGSYGHSLRECPKPRDNVAVNQARKQHKSKKNQNAGSRNATRYYQNSSGGKYDGLKPGSLDAETKRVLGLGELDPPPWLNRMRELGYPPGYLDTEGEDEPSGITIFADEDAKVEQEDGEILETDHSELPKTKKSVEFPGINAAIPENADERAWAPYDPYRKHLHHRSSDHSELISRRHHHERRSSWDEGPPGVDSVFSPPSSYPPRYGNYDSTPSYARSYSDRGRRSPLVYDDDLATNSSYSSSRRSNETDDRWRPQDEREDNERTRRSNDEHNRKRHHSWR